MRVNGRCVGGVAEIAESMQRNSSAIADGNSGAGEGFVRDRAFDYLESGLQLGLAADVYGLERHGIFRQFEAETQFHVDAGNGYGQMSAHRNFAEERARRGDLCDVADAERRQPRLRLRKPLDQTRTAPPHLIYALPGLDNFFSHPP